MISIKGNRKIWASQIVATFLLLRIVLMVYDLDNSAQYFTRDRNQLDTYSEQTTALIQEIYSFGESVEDEEELENEAWITWFFLSLQRATYCNSTSLKQIYTFHKQLIIISLLDLPPPGY